MCEEVRGLLIIRKISGDAFTQVKLLVACQKDRLKLYFYRPKKNVFSFCGYSSVYEQTSYNVFKIVLCFFGFYGKTLYKKIV